MVTRSPVIVYRSGVSRRLAITLAPVRDYAAEVMRAAGICAGSLLDPRGAATRMPEMTSAMPAIWGSAILSLAIIVPSRTLKGDSSGLNLRAFRGEREHGDALAMDGLAAHAWVGNGWRYQFVQAEAEFAGQR